VKFDENFIMNLEAVPAPAYKRTDKGNLVKKSFPVLEMTCAACAISVESILKSVDGVHDAQVNYANASTWVEYNPAITGPEKFREALHAIGYGLLIETEDVEKLLEEAQRKKFRNLRNKTFWALAISVPLVTIGMFFMDLPHANYIMLALASPVVLIAGRGFYINAWKQARHGKANMDTLVALSTGIAYIFSVFNSFYPEFWHERGLHAHVYFESASVIIAFISLGKLLEGKAKSNTSSALKKLIGLQPKTVTICLEDNAVAQIPVAQVKKGFILLVKPGEKIPVDGTVTTGKSYVDESMISGEPVPVAKEKGNKVFAGTINQKGSFRFTAEKLGSETVLGQIIKMVQEAQGSRAPVQKLVDRISGIFVPVVIGLSLLTFVIWITMGGENGFTQGLLSAITVLVIACPCALGLATPTAIMVGVGRGAEQQILIRDAESLEKALKINAIVLDKTGTITEGKPEVTNLYVDENPDGQLLKQVLFGIELQSEHPLAEAVCRYLQQEGVEAVPIQSIKTITGKGVVAYFNQHRYLVGNQGLLKDFDVNVDDKTRERMLNWQNQAKTVVFFSEDTKIVGALAISDRVKQSAAESIRSMKQAGIDVYMLTGDNQQTAAVIAKQVGIDRYQAEVLPAEKAAFIEKLQAAGKQVAMVGDGINDSQAMAVADLSIAMGKGSDIAMDIAKMTLITSDLNSIPKAFSLSAKTVKTIRQNLFWAFIYNLIGIPLAAGVLYPVNQFLLDPMIAGIAMGLSSVSVVTNSLRLKFIRL
jgi:Cu2+-exporting ATPase